MAHDKGSSKSVTIDEYIGLALVALPGKSGDEVGLPLRPIPIGFTLNTLLAASIILGLTEGAGAWRRRARRRKGRCPSCGYDRAGIADAATACPECGR